MDPTKPSPSGYREWWYLFDPRYSLRARAALLVGAAALGFMLLANWFTGTIVRRTLETQSGALMETLAFEIGDKLDRVIYERQNQLEFLANLPAFRAAPADRAGEGERRRLLESLQKESPDFSWLGLAAPTGAIVVATQGRFEGQDVGARPWFRGVRESPYAGGPREIPELPREGSLVEEGPARYLDLAIPVRGTEDRFVGVLLAHVRWAPRDVVRGIVTDALTRNQIGATIYSGSTDVLFDSGVSGWNIPPNAPSVPPRSFRGWLTELFPLGTPYLTGFARSRGFREFRGLGWLIVVRQPHTTTFAPADELRSVIGRWGLAFVVALTVATWFFFTPFARRLRGIKTAADRIRQGDVLTVMPHHHGETEISEMCHSLGELVEDFRGKNTPTAAEPPPPAEPTRPPEPRTGEYVKPTGADPRRVVW